MEHMFIRVWNHKRKFYDLQENWLKIDLSNKFIYHKTLMNILRPLISAPDTYLIWKFRVETIIGRWHLKGGGAYVK